MKQIIFEFVIMPLWIVFVGLIFYLFLIWLQKSLNKKVQKKSQKW